MNKHYSTEAIKINAFKEQNKTHEMYKTAKNKKTGFKQFKQTEISADLLKDHFKKHFKRKHTCDQIPQSLEHPPIEVQSELWQLSEEFPIDNSIPSQEEVKKVIRSLKGNKKSSDIDREIFKTACEDEKYFQNVYELIRDAFENEITPDKWKHGVLNPIHKSGNKGEGKNYRGLNLSSVIRTIVTKICVKRMSDWYEHQLHDNQNGFRKNYSTATGVLTNKLLQNIINKKKGAAFLLFVDLRAAFDKLNRNYLWKSIRNRLKPGTNTKIINVLENLYSTTTAEIKGNTQP